MSVSHRYRNLGGSGSSDKPKENFSNEEIEDQKLQSFEAGYQAGWDDAARAQSDQVGRVTAELGQNLQEMSFTYHEALAKFTAAFEPVMQQILDKLLPELHRASLSAHIIEQIGMLSKEAGGIPVEITVAPANVDKVKEMAGAALSDPFVVKGERSLGEGQAFVRFGSAERQIDLDTVVSGVSTAMSAFFHEIKSEAENG
jgi:flagellar assembly protein FliH